MSSSRRRLLLAFVLACCACKSGATTKKIGAAGGTIQSPDGKIALTIPPGALAIDVVFTVEIASNAPPGHVGNAYQLGPDGTQFAAPAQLSFSFDPTKRGLLVIATAAGSDWIPQPTFVSKSLLRANLTHLSLWGVIATPSQLACGYSAVDLQRLQYCCGIHGGCWEDCECVFLSAWDPGGCCNDIQTGAEAISLFGTVACQIPFLSATSDQADTVSPGQAYQGCLSGGGLCSCAGKQCGPDGCGGDCGVCAKGFACSSGTCAPMARLDGGVSDGGTSDGGAGSCPNCGAGQYCVNGSCKTCTCSGCCDTSGICHACKQNEVCLMQLGQPCVPCGSIGQPCCCTSLQCPFCNSGSCVSGMPGTCQ